MWCGRADPRCRHGAHAWTQGSGFPRALTRIAGRWWHHRKVHRLFGAKFWAFVVGAAPLEGELEKFWGDLGFAVVQGYGLTETAPIVTLNHPFGTQRGSVGKAIAGVEMKVADDGEILVRGENVTQGYFNADEETAKAFADGWFHTGDVGEIGADGQLFIRGRKKEMIVTAEGLNVFPEDVERVLNQLPGVRDSAAVGLSGTGGTDERVHAVLLLEPGIDADQIVRDANARLADHQKIRRALVWPEPELPRTEGTRKLKRAAIREWAKSGGTPRHVQAGNDALAALVARYAGRESVSATGDARGTRPEFARTRRADGRARRCVRHSYRRRRIAETRDACRTSRRLSTAVRRQAQWRRPSRSSFLAGIDRGWPMRSGVRVCRRGFCRGGASSPGSRCRGSSTSRKSSGR